MAAVPETINASPSIARKLAAYIPVTLTRQILQDGLPLPGRPRSLDAATLFSDISGFTAMSRELASDGPRGAEEVNRVLLLTFTAMIDILHELGGAVSHFYGDAMSVYFPDHDGTAAVRALSCAQQMQKIMLVSFQRMVTNRPPGKNPFFQLTIKIGAAYGRCQEIVVGDPQRNLEFVLTGPAVDEAAAAEKRAASGQVVASRSILLQAGLAAPDAFTQLEVDLPQPPAQTMLFWSDVDESASSRLANLAAPFIPPALHQRLVISNLDILAEHRPVTSIFVQFEYAGNGKDPATMETAETGQLLQRYFQWANSVVTRFGSSNGRVNRVLTGDKGNQLHIIFGAPVAPDAPDQALRCALALQRERPDFISVQRIGLTVGKAFAGPVGSDARREYTVVGDTVNISARLMEICADGEVLADATTADRCSSSLKLEALPPTQKIKGKEFTILPYRVLGDRAATTQLQAYFGPEDRPLIGRALELDQLLGGMDIALRGVGSMVVLSGSAGVGKTRLLAEGVRYWLEMSGLGLLGICQPHTADTPYAPWRAIWRDFFGLNRNMSATEQAHTVVATSLSLVPDAGHDVGLWGEVLGLPIPRADSLAELTAAARQARFFTLVQRCIQARAETKPLLLVLENAQWADQASMDLIDHLALHIRHSPVFLTITLRPNNFELSLAARSQPVCLNLTLQDMSPQHARDLLQSLVGERELPAPVEQQLGLRDREGRDSPVNPLFLEEALNVMLDVGVLRQNGRLRINQQLLTRMQIPDTIHGLLLARLDRLPPAGRDLLQVASVIGRQFGREPLHVMAPNLSRSLVTELLDTLSAEEMTRLVTADPEWIYLFQHAMTHEVAYESLPYARRQSLHAGLAEWLERSYADNLKTIHPILAYHFSRADNHTKALEYALTAGNDARAIYANADAVELYTLAEKHLHILGEAPWWETAVRLYLARSNALRFLGDFNAAAADATKAIGLASPHQDVLRLAQSHNLLAELNYRQGRFDDAQANAEIVISEWGTAIPQDELALAYLWCGLVAGVLQDFETALTNLHQAQEICLRTENNERLARVLEGIAFVYFTQQKLEEALIAMQHSVKLSRRFSIPVSVASALSNISLIQSRLGYYEQALETISEAIQLARDSSRNFLARFLGNKAEILTYLGDFQQAGLAFDESIKLYLATDDNQGLLDVYLVRGFEYHANLAQWEEAQLYLERAGQIIEEYPDNYPEAEARLYLSRARLNFHLGKLEEAALLCRQADSIIRERNLNWWLPVLLYWQGLTARERSQPAAAQNHFTAGLSAVSSGGNPDYLPLLFLELASLEKRKQKKVVLLQESVQAARERARYIDRVNCLKRAGKVLVKAAEPDWRRLGKKWLREAEALENDR